MKNRFLAVSVIAVCAVFSLSIFVGTFVAGSDLTGEAGRIGKLRDRDNEQCSNDSYCQQTERDYRDSYSKLVEKLNNYFRRWDARLKQRCSTQLGIEIERDANNIYQAKNPNKQKDLDMCVEDIVTRAGININPDGIDISKEIEAMQFAYNQARGANCCWAVKQTVPTI